MAKIFEEDGESGRDGLDWFDWFDSIVPVILRMSSRVVTSSSVSASEVELFSFGFDSESMVLALRRSDQNWFQETGVVMSSE